MFQVGDIVEPKDPTVKHTTKRLILEVAEFRSGMFYLYLCLVKGKKEYDYLEDKDWEKVA